MITNTLTGQNLDGVFTLIQPPPLAAVTNTATGVCVLVGTAAWGPVNQETVLGNMNDFATQFGPYQEAGGRRTDAYEQANGYFQGGEKDVISGGGADLRMIRVAAGSALPATGLLVDALAATVGTLSTKFPTTVQIQRIITGTNAIASPVAPILSHVPGSGSLPTEAITVVLTAVNAAGETAPGPSAVLTTTGPTDELVVTFPAVPAGATGWNVYAGTNPLALHLQNPIPLVTASISLAIMSLNIGSALAPSANTAFTAVTLTIVPTFLAGAAPEVFPGLTAATIAAAVNSPTTGSAYVTYAAGASVNLPTPGAAFLSGGDAGLGALDADYIGLPGIAPTGFQLANTTTDANFLVCGRMSPAIKAQMQVSADVLKAIAFIGPTDTTVTPAQAIAEQTFNDQYVAYLYAYQNWLNSTNGNTQAVLPAGSAAGAMCNGPFWVNLSQTKLLGYLGPTNPLSEADANLLAGAGIIPITKGSVCRKGSNTSNNVANNQIDAARIAITIAREADATAQPLIAKPILFDSATGISPFYDELKNGLETVMQNQPAEAINQWVVNANYNGVLAAGNKAFAQIRANLTGKALQIVISIGIGLTEFAILPA